MKRLNAFWLGLQRLVRSAAAAAPRRGWVAGALVLGGGTSLAAGPDRLGTFDFAYEVTGDARVRPVQVFDDGRETYLQFRAGDTVPAVFALTAQGPVLVQVRPAGAYAKLPFVASGFLLRLGYGLAQVKYTAAGRADLSAQQAPAVDAESAAQSEAAMRLLAATRPPQLLPDDPWGRAATAPRLQTNSYATPLRGDSVEWSAGRDDRVELGLSFPIDRVKLPAQADARLKQLVARAAQASRVEVLGRDDPGHKLGVAEARAEAVAQALVAAGVDRARIDVKTSSQVRELTPTSVEGVSIILTERRASASSATRIADASPAMNAAEVARRLRAGDLSPNAAADLLERSQASGRTATTASGAGTPVASAPVRDWAMRKGDETVQRMLERWAQEAGWRLVWEGAPAVPIAGDASLDRLDFLQAADQVVRQARAAGYRLRATAYANQVLQITGD